MPVLAANASINFPNYPRGAVLTITAPATPLIGNFPSLGKTGTGPTVTIDISHVPKTATLAQNTLYTLTAGNVPITYNVR